MFLVILDIVPIFDCCYNDTDTSLIQLSAIQALMAVPVSCLNRHFRNLAWRPNFMELVVAKVFDAQMGTSWGLTSSYLRDLETHEAQFKQSVMRMV